MNRRLFLGLGAALWVPERVRVYSFGAHLVDDYVEELRGEIMRRIAWALEVPVRLLDPGYIPPARIDSRVGI